jgi:hypothetical protein
VQRKCACGGASRLDDECEKCRLQRLSVQRRAAAKESAPSEIPTIVHEVLRSPGRPLDAATRAFFEPRFGHDFSEVRVHTDAKAAESARSVNALAYTVGRDVVFGTGQYAPYSREGRRLLAHELGHVVQQSAISASFAGLQKQAARKRITREHVPAAPSLRPTEGEVVSGFPLTRVHCGCGTEIDVEERGIDEAIEAFAACQRRGVQSVVELYSCVRHRILGPKLAALPPAAWANPRTSKIEWPTEQVRREQAEMLKDPDVGPCVPLVWWSTLTHETQHLKQFEEVAAKLGPQFLAEFNRLTGDPERMEKLARRFPRQTQKYMAETELSVRWYVKIEIEAYQQEKRFLADVRAALLRICRRARAPRPTVERPLPERRRLQRRLVVDRLDDSYEREAGEMAEWTLRMPDMEAPKRSTAQPAASSRSVSREARPPVLQLQRRDANETGEGSPRRSSCECDCESYCGRVANRYARDHISYPSWFGERPRSIRVELTGTTCAYQRRYPPPCSWVCTADLKSDIGNLPVIVQLMASRRFNVATVSRSFPLCSYDFKCADNVLALSEVGCIKR